MAYVMPTPKEHIEEIRKKKYSIGSEVSNPLTEELHQAVRHLSAELYAKDVHFLMELIQNAEDNEYPEGVDPSLEFVITSRDITGTGAPATLLMFNNERGFSAKNIESICSVGRSTKKGNRKRGYIGEKGIGFKSVFLITAEPYIFSNGYKIKFDEEPCPHCNLGYVVPEWVEENPSLSDIQKIYGSGSTLPTTTLVLPLKPDKVKPVKNQLSSVHPEILLFLSKIKQLSIREDNEDPRLNTVSGIAITSETDFVARKNIDAESYTLHLSANGDQFDKECSYYMWREKFPVKKENKVERRMEVEEWVITLAFPFGQRLERGATSPGVYAFLPTEMVTNFPFIIQADFLLASSRETIRFDDKWNQGILNCVPSAFVNALVSLVKLTEDAPVSSLPRMFRFLPVNSSSYQELNDVREGIRAILAEEDIIPSESCMEQKFFHKPRQVGRLMPSFWNILEKAKVQGVSLKNLSHHGVNVLNSSFDKEEYDPVLNFLGVGLVNNEWYARCIQSSNLVLGVSEEVYWELLLFVAENWSSKFFNTKIANIPLIKYVDLDGNVELCSITASAQSYNQRVVCMSRQESWLINWNREFRCVANRFFMPESTHVALRSCSKYKKEVVLEWLKSQVNVAFLTVYGYAGILVNCLNKDRRLVVAYAHFLFHSHLEEYLTSAAVDYLCGLMPLVDNYGVVRTKRNGVLVPANLSKWVELVGSTTWRQEDYVELGEDYLRPGFYAGQSTSGKQFMEFLKSHAAASDIPYLSPPNAAIQAVSGPLTKENAFLLLDWIQKLRYGSIPEKFLRSIKDGSWLKITMNGYSSYRPPSQSFFLTSSLGNILQEGSVLVDIPLVNESYYGEQINEYKEELKTIGVIFEYKEACEFIGNRLMSLVTSSSVTKDNAFSILHFIKFLRERYLPPDSFIQSIRKGSWLKTSHGYRSPGRSVLHDQEWKAASQISDIPFIDQNYYGDEILRFKVELQLLGVKVGFNREYQLVIDNLKSPPFLTCLTADALLLVLACLRQSESACKVVNTLRNKKCLKTNAGYKSPGECFLFDPEWGCLFEVFRGGFPIIDQNFYGSNIVSLKNQLKQLGVLVDFEDAVKAFVSHFKRQASSISKDQGLLILSCYRKLKGMSRSFPTEFGDCVREVKWLKTRFGDYRSPEECILFGPDWESISPITLLPFIDDRFYGMDMQEYSKELKSMGIIVAFEEGAHFVASGLCFPSNPCRITRANVFALLKCIRILQGKNYDCPKSFSRKVSQKWLKTSSAAGYSRPNKCLLFDSLWESYPLERTDGPFIDEEFYGSEIKSYKKELSGIGVTVDVQKGCPLLAKHLDFHRDFGTIVRIYNFLAEVKWAPDSEAAQRIWIPDGSENGQWVSPGECVLHDRDDLFGSRLNVLEKHYEPTLLSFFSRAFSVKSNPSIDDYCKLWKDWESSGQKLSIAECCAFWGFAMKHWSAKTEKLLTESLKKLPVDSGNGGILLFDKDDVFLADDLQLKDIFEQSSPHSLFVWYPEPSLPALPRTKLLESYRKIGVRTISESVQKEELSLGEGVELRQVNQKNSLVGKGLIKLILGFLADPAIEMDAAKRHETVEYLLNLTVLESAEPISVRYTLSLSSGKTVDVRASQMTRWDRESGKLFTQKIGKSDGHKNLIEYATHFAEIISKRVLWDREDHTNAMCELIKLAFLVEFNEEAVDFLMKSKNMQVFKEDEEFLSGAFPPDSE
ncbi:DNA binding ATP binding [Melia azedarach]|uniref:DNA binding ATP binding n=1 Tax=Melia azedarach TaxID=155640 RepID=A0ACC1Z1Y5_MELAZ|nr:DNA binding ATP binding [Melia azedarach]